MSPAIDSAAVVCAVPDSRGTVRYYASEPRYGHCADPFKCVAGRADAYGQGRGTTGPADGQGRGYPRPTHLRGRGSPTQVTPGGHTSHLRHGGVVDSPPTVTKGSTTSPSPLCPLGCRDGSYSCGCGESSVDVGRLRYLGWVRVPHLPRRDQRRLGPGLPWGPLVVSGGPDPDLARLGRTSRGQVDRGDDHRRTGGRDPSRRRGTSPGRWWGRDDLCPEDAPEDVGQRDPEDLRPLGDDWWPSFARRVRRPLSGHHPFLDLHH